MPPETAVCVEFLARLGDDASVNPFRKPDESRSCRLGESKKVLEPCSIVIFGASGDLTSRKLIPALYHLSKEKQMPADYRIMGFARRQKTDDTWRDELRKDLERYSRTQAGG